VGTKSGLQGHITKVGGGDQEFYGLAGTGMYAITSTSPARE